MAESINVLSALERIIDRGGDTEVTALRIYDAVNELIEAASQATATLGHAYHTTLTGRLAEYAHNDYQRLDSALARVRGE